MSSYDECPSCGREALDAISSNYFPLQTCDNCGAKFCSECGPPCPECDSEDYTDKGDEVYFRD